MHVQRVYLEENRYTFASLKGKMEITNHTNYIIPTYMPYKWNLGMEILGEFMCYILCNALKINMTLKSEIYEAKWKKEGFDFVYGKFLSIRLTCAD